MTDIGLNTNIYYLTSKYLEIINDFLVSIKDGSTNISMDKINEIKDLFEKLNDEETIDPKIQTLSIIIESELRKLNFSKAKFFDEVTTNLTNQKYSHLSKNLTHVVNALDNEYSDALAKMGKG